MKDFCFNSEMTGSMKQRDLNLGKSSSSLTEIVGALGDTDRHTLLLL